MQKFDAEKIILTKWQLYELRQVFRLVFDKGYACAVIVYTRPDQL